MLLTSIVKQVLIYSSKLGCLHQMLHLPIAKQVQTFLSNVVYNHSSIITIAKEQNIPASYVVWCLDSIFKRSHFVLRFTQILLPQIILF